MAARNPGGLANAELPAKELKRLLNIEAKALQLWEAAIGQRRLNVDELWRQAKPQRMQRVMAPYLEALL